jgi:hypothetical protein
MKTKEEVKKVEELRSSEVEKPPLPRERDFAVVLYKNRGNELKKSLKTKEDECCKLQNEPKTNPILSTKCRDRSLIRRFAERREETPHLARYARHPLPKGRGC